MCVTAYVSPEINNNDDDDDDDDDNNNNNNNNNKIDIDTQQNGHDVDLSDFLRRRSTECQ